MARLLAWSLGLLVLGWFTLMGATAAVGLRRKSLAPPPDPASDEIDVVLVFESLALKSTAKAFRGGSIEAWYGGGSFDFRGATLDPAGARLKTRAIFAGGQILVPPEWRVTSNVSGIGGVGDARPAVDRAADAPELAIDGWVLFGGWGIMSEDPRPEAATASA
jgi:hypothetical protein